MPHTVVADAATYRWALTEVIAAAYRVLDAWEAGDLAGRVTVLGETARHWDGILGLGVAGRVDDTDEDIGRQGKKEEGRRMSKGTPIIAPASLRAWALRGLDDALATALRLDDYPAARVCADLALFTHALAATALPTSPALDGLLATLQDRVTRLAAHRDALNSAAWSRRQEIEIYTRRLERRTPDGPLLAAKLRRRYAAAYDLLPRLPPGENVPDHADEPTMEDLITELKDALGIA